MSYSTSGGESKRQLNRKPQRHSQQHSGGQYFCITQPLLLLIALVLRCTWCSIGMIMMILIKYLCWNESDVIQWETQREKQREKILNFLAVWPFRNWLSLNDHNWFTKWFIVLYYRDVASTRFQFVIPKLHRTISLCIFWILFPLYCH